tara:strand:+ start:765 stop:1169 length:405 start_codon:yes stop_codon:yes gene_type:complete
MKIRTANKNDAELIKKLHKQHKKHIGNFNLFWIWDKFLEGGTTYTYVVIDNIAFMRYGYSKKYKANVLYEIGVDTESTQKGAGRMLYDHLPTPLMLKCNVDNDIGNKFYKAMGMTKAGITQTKAGEKQNIWWTS